MRILLLHNPIAGSGRATVAANEVGRVLRDAGHETVVERTDPHPDPEWLVPALDGIDLLVAVGGDGAVRLAAGPAARTGTPLYTYPMGTENLFAREFGIRRSRTQLREAVARFGVRRVDVGTAGDRIFVLMASMGFDAAMVRDLALARRGGINHLSYVVPLLRQLVRWQAPTLTVHVDGEPVVRERRGIAFVGNSRQYALRLDPAARASMTDGRLDVVFFPCVTGAAALAWWIACAFRRQTGRDRVPYRRGTRVRVRATPAHPYQIDGDPGPGSPASELTLGLRAAALPVLLPGSSAAYST
jgi:diacylglycerol kinase family enzyme